MITSDGDEDDGDVSFLVRAAMVIHEQMVDGGGDVIISVHSGGGASHWWQ